jgi:hypothetical protein
MKAYRIESLFGKSVKGSYFLERTFGQLYRDGTAWRLSPGIVIWMSADADPLKVPVPGVLENCPAEVVARCSPTRAILRFTPTLPDNPEFLPDVGVVPQFIELAYMDPDKVNKGVTDVVAGDEIGSPEQHTGACPSGIPTSACSRRVEITMIDSEGNYLDPLMFVPVKNQGDPVLTPFLDKTPPVLTATDIHLFPNDSQLPSAELPRSGGVIDVKGDVDIVAVVKDLGPSACGAAGNCEAAPLPDQAPLALKSLSYQILDTTGQPGPGSERKVRFYCLPQKFHKSENAPEDDDDLDQIYDSAFLPTTSSEGLPYNLTNLSSWVAAHCPDSPTESETSFGKLSIQELEAGGTYVLRVSATDHANQTAAAEVQIRILKVADVDVDGSDPETAEVPSVLPAAQNPLLHFVTARQQNDVVLVARVKPDIPGFRDKITWKTSASVTLTSPAIGGDKSTMKFSSNFAQGMKIPITIKVDGEIVREIVAWVVSADMAGGVMAPVVTPREQPNPLGQNIRIGTIVSATMKATATIRPAEIITDSDRPNLTGPEQTAAPGENIPCGKPFTGGVNARWDISRRIASRAGPVPFGLTLSCDDQDRNYPEDPAVGNDDSLSPSEEEDNDPYTTPGLGQLHGFDPVPRSGPIKSNVGDIYQIRLWFQEFARLDIAGRWYVISDPLPWRVDFRMRKLQVTEAMWNWDVNNDGDQADNVTEQMIGTDPNQDGDQADLVGFWDNNGSTSANDNVGKPN